MVKAVNAVFNADWAAAQGIAAQGGNQSAPAWAHKVLVLSPGTSAHQIIQVIDQPGRIDIEDEEIGPYAPTLDAIAAKGRLARVIMPANINAQDRQDARFLEAHGVQVRLLPVKPIYLHAKLVVSKTTAYIGSENLTQTSLEVNREVGLLLNGSDIPKLQAQFNRDWARARNYD